MTALRLALVLCCPLPCKVVQRATASATSQDFSEDEIRCLNYQRPLKIQYIGEVYIHGQIRLLF